ncbi:hypothetical protein FA13DRAFT_1736938 [Coprinellus micaceus]|uniref:Uncharacterized protein n=1 Tax=Coprinellus micaceus TaxID=71717 RepID=A0A4Y7T0S0_COPMI|nr:hypothetical protein FA13DRAFT_1736938 [Coprinellus micaceus]
MIVDTPKAVRVPPLGVPDGDSYWKILYQCKLIKAQWQVDSQRAGDSVPDFLSRSPSRDARVDAWRSRIGPMGCRAEGSPVMVLPVEGVLVIEIGGRRHPSAKFHSLSGNFE